MAFEPRLCTSDEPVLADLSFCGPTAADATGMTGMGLPGGPSACSRARTRKASEPIFFRFSSALAARAASSPVGAAWLAAGGAADCEASASPGGASSATASRTGSPGGLSGDPAGSGGWLFPDQGDSLRTLPPMPFIGSGGAATLSSHPRGVLANSAHHDAIFWVAARWNKLTARSRRGQSRSPPSPGA